MTNSTGKTDQPELLRFSLFEQYKEITHFVTTRHGGVSSGNYDSFNLSFYSEDEPAAVTRNRHILCSAIDTLPESLIIPCQTHGDQVRMIDREFMMFNPQQRVKYLQGVDALVTNQPQICIGVTTADCVPVLIYDPVKQAAAVVHAGWRGTVARIAGKTVREMQESFSCNPADMIAAIGPSIGPDAFEVGEEVAEEFRNNGFEQTIISNNHKPHINLWMANQQDLSEAGLRIEQIEIAGICTYTNHEQFFSARRLGIKSGRLVTGIVLK